jgi:hypothetical protein
MIMSKRTDKARGWGNMLPTHIVAAINHPRAGDTYSVKVHGRLYKTIVLAVTRRAVRAVTVTPDTTSTISTHSRRKHAYALNLIWDRYPGTGRGLTFHAPRKGRK